VIAAQRVDVARGQAAPQRVAVGSDADLTLWDPGERRVINGAAMASRAGYSVYDGWAVTGWPRFVLRRGQTVLAEGQCTAQPGQGQWVRRGPAPGPDVRASE